MTFDAKEVVIDGRGHLLGRLSSIVAKVRHRWCENHDDCFGQHHTHEWKERGSYEDKERHTNDSSPCEVFLCF